MHPVGSGELEFDEFLTLTARFLVEEDTEAMQEELREAFRMYDKEGNGYIPTSALREILKALDDKLTEDELDEMIAEIDTDGSGTVDFDGKCSVLVNHMFDNRFVVIHRIHGNDDWRLERWPSVSNRRGCNVPNRIPCRCLVQSLLLYARPIKSKLIYCIRVRYGLCKRVYQKGYK